LLRRASSRSGYLNKIHHSGEKRNEKLTGGPPRRPDSCKTELFFPAFFILLSQPQPGFSAGCARGDLPAFAGGTSCLRRARFSSQGRAPRFQHKMKIRARPAFLPRHDVRGVGRKSSCGDADTPASDGIPCHQAGPPPQNAKPSEG